MFHKSQPIGQSILDNQNMRAKGILMQLSLNQANKI